MLVLARKQGEKVNIGTAGEIEITVVDISNGKIRLGISAPREVPVHRHEVFETIQAEASRRAAADAAAAPAHACGC